MRRLAVLGVGAVLVGTSCGITGDAELQEIDTADLFGLDATTTSSIVVDLERPGDRTSGSYEPGDVDDDRHGAGGLVLRRRTHLTDVSRDLARGAAPSSPLRVVTALLDGATAG